MMECTLCSHCDDFFLRILCQVLVYEEMGCHVGCDGVVGSVKLFSKRPAGELSASDVVGAPLPLK